MNFADSVSIVITRIFIFAVTDCVAYALQVIVTIIFIGVERRFRLSKVLHKRTEGVALRVLHHANTHLARGSPNDSTHWWTVIVIGTASTLFIDSPTGWILRITAPFSFFPPRSGTFRRFRLPDRSGVRCFVAVLHWLGVSAALPMLSCD